MVGRGFNGEELGTNFLEGVTVASSSGPSGLSLTAICPKLCLVP